MTEFSWHRHEDDANTGKSGVPVWPSFSRQSCAKVGNKTKTKQKLETEAGNIQGDSEKILETFYAKNTDEQLGNVKDIHKSDFAHC